MSPKLKSRLDEIYARYHSSQYLDTDPLQFVYDYHNPLDQEVVGLVSALMAYGHREQIKKSVKTLLLLMKKRHSSPKDFVLSLQDSRARTKAESDFEGFVHRFNRGQDWVMIFRLLSDEWRTHGSLGEAFVSHGENDFENIQKPLSRLLREWKKKTKDAPASLKFLLSSPEDGSTCKRWCMFLRWMGRQDQIDPGLWVKAGVRPQHLVMPLDTHTGRFCQELGLTKRATLNWSAALEITQNLKSYDAYDPTRIDFALCRVGMLGDKL